MGFFGKDSISHTDKVWKTRPLLLRGLTTEALNVVKEKGTAVVASWFKDRKQSISEFFVANKVPHEVLSDSALVSPEPEIYLADASTFMSSVSITQWLTRQASVGKVIILFDGHYPLIPPEEKVLDMIKVLDPKNTRVVFCESLDAPRLKQYGGERMVKLLESLGMNEDSLEHSMITSSIMSARKKFTKGITHEIASDKEDEWFMKNVK